MFKELPRFCGFPNQVFVRKKFAFNSFFRTFNGKAPFFVSTYQFKDKITPIVDCLVFDIDSYFGLRIPYNNTRNLKRFCDKNNFPYLIDLSGGKGFHLFMIIKDIVPETEVEKEKLKNKIYSVQVAICKMLDIGAVDYATFGRLHFLIRYPTSKYMRKDEETKKMEWNGLYCRNLSSRDFDGGLRHIARMAKTSGEVPNKPRTSVTLDNIITKLPKYKLIERTNGEDKIELIRSGMSTPSVCAIGLPCMKEFVKHHHPPHYERVELVAWLKFLGYSDLSIGEFIKNCNWTKYKPSTTRYQITTILPRHPKCKVLRESYGDLCRNCPLGWRKR